MSDIEKPTAEELKKRMFFKGMKFLPDESLRQVDLNRLAPHLLKMVFLGPEGEPVEIIEHEHSMRTLAQFLISLDIMLDEDAFEYIPEDLRKHFIVRHRDDTQYRYGQRPGL